MSSFTRTQYLDAITHALTYLRSKAKSNNAINKYSINIEAEDFYAGFLNEVFGFELKSANHEKKNVLSIDLYEESKRDDGQRVAIQVTSQNDSHKIKKILQSFTDHGYQKFCTRLIIFIITNKKNYNTVFSFPENTGIQFDQTRDILDTDDLLKYIHSIDNTDHIQRIYEYLNKELSPEVLGIQHTDKPGYPNNREIELNNNLMSIFSDDRKTHPSIRMMDPDPLLLPKGLPEILSDGRYAVEDNEEPRSIKDMIFDSWKREDRRHILLIGEGGIGKTVAMLTLPEEDWFKRLGIPAIYVPLQSLDKYDGDLNRYLEVKFGADIYNRIIELSNSIPDGHPKMMLLLDGFNEIPDKYKQSAGKHIREWMMRPGIQIITTSRLGFSLENSCSKYRLQPLPYDTVRSFLLSSGIKEESLPGESDRISNVINVPLMLAIYTQIERVKDEADRSSAARILEWKEPDNAAHIIWDYLQIELYRSIERNDSSHSVMKNAIAILAVAPYICCQMSQQIKFYIKQGEFIKLIREALTYYASHQKLLNSQILNIRKEFYPYHDEESLFQESKAAEYARILIYNTALFQNQIIRVGEGENKAVIDNLYSLMHLKFRDALAAFFICSCLSKTSDGREKKALLDYSDYFIKNYMAEHLSGQELVSIWDKHRKEEPEDGQITFILLDLIGRQMEYDYRKLDFSGIDLTKTNLHSLLSRRMDICPLSPEKENFERTKVSLECLFPNGHAGGVNSVAYSPDGRHLASGADDRTVRVWNLENGECRVLQGHAGGVNSVVYSPDGRHLASGAYDSTVRVWNLENGECSVLQGHAGGVNSVAYSPDGRHLASGADDRTVRVWDLESGESRVLQGYTGGVRSVAYSPDGRCLASSADDSTIRIWNLWTGESRVLQGHTGGVRSVAYSPDGSHLASGADDSTIRVWDLVSDECRVLQGHAGGVRSVAYSPYGSHLASGADDSTVRVWDLENGESRVLLEYANQVLSVKYSPDGRLLSSGTMDSEIRIRDLEEYKEVKKFVIVPHLNLRGANFELAIIDEKDKEILIAAGVKVMDAGIYTDINPSSESQFRKLINSFIEQKPESYYCIDDFVDFLQQNSTDNIHMLLSGELRYLFYFSEPDNIVPMNSDSVLQQLLYQIWMIDSFLLKEEETISKLVDIFSDSTKTENSPSKDSQLPQYQQQGHEDDTPPLDMEQDSSVPDKYALEEATLLVVKSFQRWLIEKLEKCGIKYSVIQQAYRQSSGEQYGYDVGLELKIGEATYKLSFECKDYTSNIKENGKNSNINVRAYAINLLKYFINSNPEINNRWVLINPFGNLQNDYPNKLFENWNRHHSYMHIFAITEDQSFPTCSDFFSVNETAFQKIYHRSNLSSVIDDKTDKLFSYIYETIIGEDYVSMDIKKKLKRYSFPSKFLCAQPSNLLSERTKDKAKDKPIALEEILRYLTEIHNETKSRSKKGIYVIGEYGTGKTWLLYQTIVEIIHHSAKYPFIPVLMKLKEFFVGLNELNDLNIVDYDIQSVAEKYVERVLDQQDFLEEYSMKDMSPVFLLDGFDEVLSGLSATNNKIKILLTIKDILESRYKNKHPIFIITSRESDFHACQTNEQFINRFGQFYKIILEDCPVTEAKEKLLKYSESVEIRQESVISLLENPDILKLACRPVFFALLAQLLLSGKSSLEGVVDEFSLLNTAIDSEICRTIDELCKSKEIPSTDITDLRQSLLEALLDCAIYCTQNNVNESPIVFSRKELYEITPSGIVSVKNKSVESATQEKPWTFKVIQYNERRVSFLHNIIREFLVAKKLSILMDKCVLDITMEKLFFNMLRSVQMSPASLRFFLMFLKKSTQKETIEEKLIHWLCNPEIKSNLTLSTKLLEILLQPDSEFGGSENALLDLSGIHADNLCIWNCHLHHLDFKESSLRNMQMTNTKLHNVDLRGADLSGLRLAPSKSIKDVCFWNQESKWNLAVLYQNGQVLRYTFTNSFMQGSYTVKLLSRYEGATSLFSINNAPYIIISGKTIYPLEGKDESQNALYSMNSGKSIQQIIPQGKWNSIIVQNGNDCQLQVINAKMLASQNFNITESDLFFLTKDGMLVLAIGDALTLISQTGVSKILSKWENNYECFSIHQHRNDENYIYIKTDTHLIRNIYDEEFNSKSMPTEYPIEGTCGTMQKIRVLKEDILIGISDSDLYVMTLKTNKVIAEKVNTAVEASHVKLANEDGSKKMKDQEAYELITGSVISNNDAETSGR